MGGWAPAQVTYDSDGNVLTVTVTEPRFTRAEVEQLLSSRRLEREPRGSHGWTLADATDPDKKWVVPLPKRDYVATKIRAEQELYRKRYPDADHSALLWSARPQEE